MRFLSNFFSTAPSTYDWPIIATSISSGFQVAKQQWFSQCVVAVDLGLFADKQLPDPNPSLHRRSQEKVVQTELGGDAALAITGYQINCASDLIAENGYISKPIANDFVDLLRERVSGVETGQLLKYLRRYDAMSNDASTQRFKFAVDIARYITNEEPSMILSLHVAALAEKLSALTCVVIAKAFGDSSRVHKLSRQIQLFDEQF